MFSKKQQAPFKVHLSMIILQIFHFIRQLISYYYRKDQFVIFLMSNCLFQMASEVLLINKMKFGQKNVQFVFILINVVLFQVESIKYGFENVECNSLFIIIIFLLKDCQHQHTNTEKKIQQAMKIGLLLVIFFSFTHFKLDIEDNRTIFYYFRIFNQKLNVALSIYLLSEENEKQDQEKKMHCLSIIDEKVIPMQQKVLEQRECRKKGTKRYSFQELSELITERKLTYQKYQSTFSIDENILLEFLSEAVIIIKFEKNEDSIYKPRVDYQNSISKVMFQKSNSDLITFFEKISSEILSDDSPVNPRSSLLSFQSLAQQQYKNMKRSNKFNPQQFIVTELKPNIKCGDQSLSPRLRSLTIQLNTVQKCMYYVFNTKRQRFEVNGKAEALIIETNFEIDGQKKTVEIIITIGGEDQILMIARDVMHRKNIKELLEINQSKSKILSFVSHEFRSPLNVMINVLQNMKQDNSISDSVLQNLTIVLENSFYMLNLSNDLLDLAQIKNETFSLNLKTMDIIQLGEECIKMFQLQARQKNILLFIKTNIKPLYLYTDRNRLKQIIINLLANAMKFTSKGNIIIKIQQKGLLVDIGVEDTGLGISQQDQSKLFKAFGKLKDREHQKLNEQGVGLGLVISHKIAQQLSFDGQGLQVISKDATQEDHGSYFYLTLKIKYFHTKTNLYQLQQVQINDKESLIQDTQIEFQQIRLTINKDAHSFADAEKFSVKSTCKHILIVDDNIFNQDVLEMLIKQFTNTQIDKSNSGLEAIESVKSKKCNESCIGYQAIFMDMEMPGLNGMQASAQILKIDPKIKIFIVSGYDKSQFDGEVNTIRIKDYIVKPIHKDVIQKIILENYL
ncbi:unnamed protein product (macronuclear) [Paramecium tetraurelia]|uniref:Histidine kinase n=1 Tax=Paramecium tetraurelia TaxID=5888 RepID=A0DWJ3_PARTE|nr:uncharacterized protein GSPATT00021053001 [Paramecium tetraurelia]CAK87410.1 unnamed protein product [Paramecium tetraurelia]|eukprot:XP_001454807.1 hypothetical protein (macronuclear) [Paramecium tetraurelia strain d4-2]